MNESNRREEYLWDPANARDPLVAALEHVVEPCRFEPVPLILPTTKEQPMQVANSSAWPAIAGACAAAAAAVLLWGVWRTPEPPPEPVIEVSVAAQAVHEPDRGMRIDGDPLGDGDEVTGPRLIDPIPSHDLSEGQETTKTPEKGRPAKPKKHKKPKPPANEWVADELPERLGAKEIRAGVLLLRDDARECGAKHRLVEGTKVGVRFDIEGKTGRPLEVKVLGEFGEHSVAECLGSVAMSARFDRFTRESQAFTYKFKM